MEKLTKQQAEYLMTKIRETTEEYLADHELNAPSYLIPCATLEKIMKECTQPAEPQLLQDLRIMAKDLIQLRADFDNFTAGCYRR
jgi:hypothetical protein